MRQKGIKMGNSGYDKGYNNSYNSTIYVKNIESHRMEERDDTSMRAGNGSLYQRYLNFAGGAALVALATLFIREEATTENSPLSPPIAMLFFVIGVSMLVMNGHFNQQRRRDFDTEIAGTKLKLQEAVDIGDTIEANQLLEQYLFLHDAKWENDYAHQLSQLRREGYHIEDEERFLDARARLETCEDQLQQQINTPHLSSPYFRNARANYENAYQALASTVLGRITDINKRNFLDFG